MERKVSDWFRLDSPLLLLVATRKEDGSSLGEKVLQVAAKRLRRGCEKRNNYYKITKPFTFLYTSVRLQ